MKKRLLTAALSLVVVMEGLAVSACGEKQTSDEFDYEALYRTERTQPYAEEDRLTSRASYGYTLNRVQGYNGWYYLSGNGTNLEEMAYDDGKWSGAGAWIDGACMVASENADAVRKYVVSGTGEGVLYGNFKCESSSSAGAQIAVSVNGQVVFSDVLSAGDTEGKYFERTVGLKAGDEILFSVSGKGCAVLFNPVVTFENAQNKSLYHLTAAGKQYGDVFPYYDGEEGKLYMGFLWSDDARQGVYNDALELSDNLLTFTDVPQANNYDVWQKYYRNYRLHALHDCNKFIDRTLYPFGVRDNFLYYDGENERYLMVAGAYRRFDAGAQTSDLVICASDDPFALSWSKPAVIVEENYSRNLPECPSLMKIGDRWYVFVSVAYNTAHQVGPLQYWTGDAGVDCLDVGWTEKEFSFFDGEDLCAARPTQVGDKVYVWGWIPALYDGMPWAPWAGYLNLPREVVQHADGSLGGRLDPALSKLLDYGRIYDLAEHNFTVASGNASYADGVLSLTGNENYVALGEYHRTLTKFRMRLNSGAEIGYAMRQNGKEYKIVVTKEADGTWMKVLSPDDPSHTVNSALQISAAEEEFEVQIVCDGEFVEFFVNGEYALTAHTAMDGNSHQAYLYSAGEGQFKDVVISKLLPYGELE